MDPGRAQPFDGAIIDRCLGGDEAAWEQVVARFKRKVFHIAYKFTGRHDAAEDLTQEVFLKVFKSLDKFHRDADFSTWLSSVARNYCIDHYRASKREKEVVVEDLVAFDLAPASSGSNPHRALEDHDRRRFLRRGLEALPEKLREAVVLRGGRPGRGGRSASGCFARSRRRVSSSRPRLMRLFTVPSGRPSWSAISW